MGFLNRFVAVIKGWANALLRMGEDPEVMARQKIQELKDAIPRLDEGVIKSATIVKELESRREKLELESKELMVKLEGAVNTKNESLGVKYASRYKMLEASLVNVSASLETARKAYTKMLQVRKSGQQSIESEVNKIEFMISNRELAIVKGDIASLFKSYLSTGRLGVSDDIIKQLEKGVFENDAKYEDAFENEESSLDLELQDSTGKAFYEELVSKSSEPVVVAEVVASESKPKVNRVKSAVVSK